MRLASIEGLGSLTFGRLSQELGITKSGVFAHFRSKEQLQNAVIEAAQEVFDREVLGPGLVAPEGLQRLIGLCGAYLSYIERGVFPGGCFFAQLLADFDAPEGPVHDRLVAGQRGWMGLLTTQIETAQHHGELPTAVDPPQLAFEVYAAVELANYLFTLFEDPSIVDYGRNAIDAAITRAMGADLPVQE